MKSVPGYGDIKRDPDFTDRPFVAGTLTGVRCFRLDKLGRLNAMNSFPNPVWTPGENIAECHRQWAIDENVKFYQNPSFPASSVITSNNFTASMQSMINSITYGGGSNFDMQYYHVPEHDVAAQDCVCGFYAYFDNGNNPHDSPGAVHGVIEGYGRLTVGARGFRCPKARIKALVLPKVRSALLMQVAVNYDGIRIFTSIDEALKVFPLTLPGDVPNPANTPDFWTRKSA